MNCIFVLYTQLYEKQLIQKMIMQIQNCIDENNDDKNNLAFVLIKCINNFAWLFVQVVVNLINYNSF